MPAPRPTSARPTARLVAAGYCRLSVVTDAARVDVALPDTVPLTELLPELMTLLSLDVERPMRLSRVDGGRLALDRSLSDLGVLTGDVVCLVAEDAAVPSPVVDDVVTAVAETFDGRQARWDLGRLAVSGQAAGLLAIAAGVVPLLLGRLSAADAVTAGVMAVLLVTAVLAVASRMHTAVRTGLIVVAALYAAVCGLAVVAAGTSRAPSLASAVAAAGVGVAVVGVAVVPRAGRAVPVALLSVALSAGGAAAGVRFLGGSLPEVAAVDVVAWLWLSGLAERVVLRSERLRVSTGRSPALRGDAVRDVENRTALALDTLTGVVVGGSASLAAGAVLLALTDSPWGWALAGVGALGALLRTRRFAALMPVLALAGAALLGLLALACRLVLGLGPHPYLVVVFVGAGVVLVVLTSLLAPLDFGPGVGLAVDRIEVPVALALLPLMLGAFGVYDSVHRAAQNVH